MGMAYEAPNKEEKVIARTPRHHCAAKLRTAHCYAQNMGMGRIRN